MRAPSASSATEGGFAAFSFRRGGRDCGRKLDSDRSIADRTTPVSSTAKPSVIQARTCAATPGNLRKRPHDLPAARLGEEEEEAGQQDVDDRQDGQHGPHREPVEREDRGSDEVAALLVAQGQQHRVAEPLQEGRELGFVERPALLAFLLLDLRPELFGQLADPRLAADLRGAGNERLEGSVPEVPSEVSFGIRSVPGAEAQAELPDPEARVRESGRLVVDDPREHQVEDDEYSQDAEVATLSTRQ